MYKYLLEKIDNEALETPQICLISFEAGRSDSSEVFDHFLNQDTETICKVLGFKTDDKTMSLVDSYMKDGASCFAYECIRVGREGFLAEASISGSKDIKLDEKGSFISCSNAHFSYIRFIYADTIAELTDKLLKINLECYQKDLDAQNEELKNGK